MAERGAAGGDDLDPDAAVARLRRICLALPEVEERPFGGHTSPAWRVRDRMFVVVGESRESVTLKVPAGVNALLAADDPDRFFLPPYVGHKGWVGVRLGGQPDWEELDALVAESYRLIAPKRLAALVPGG